MANSITVLLNPTAGNGRKEAEISALFVARGAKAKTAAVHSALVLQAGTLSTRGRGEPNAFNVVRLERPFISVDRRTWDATRQVFDSSWTGEFQCTPQGWITRPAR